MKLIVLGCALALAWGTTAAAITDAQKCQAAKLKVSGKMNFCRLKAAAKAVKTGDPVDYSKCNTNFNSKWGTAETSGAGMCPTNGDVASMQSRIIGDADDIIACLNGSCPPVGVNLLATGQTSNYGPGSDGDVQAGAPRSYTDNGDGTITDNKTGLMWEKKSDDGSVHDKDNQYTWCKDTSPADDTCDTAGNPMDGTMVTSFLAALNSGGGFAGFTDWRIPNRFELESTLNLENVFPPMDAVFSTGCAPGCAVTTCSCTLSGDPVTSAHWTSTNYQFDPTFAWYVDFSVAFVGNFQKGTDLYVRAVRGGL